MLQQKSTMKKFRAQQLVTRWQRVLRRSAVLMSQIKYLLSRPMDVLRKIRFSRQFPRKGLLEESFPSDPRDRQKDAAWVSTLTYCNPYRPIPNCRKFKITLGMFDPLFLLFGFRKRLNTETEIHPHSNRSMNRFIKYQVIRLNRLRDEKKNEQFWKLAVSLILHSECFLILGVNHVFPQWQRHQPLSFILSLCHQVKRLNRDLAHAQGWDAKINFRRVYIPKPNGQLRPLGVPTPKWRVALHMWAQMFSIYTHTWMSKHQHGFMSGRGTLTAWRDLLSRIKDEVDIYEYDLKDCFNKLRVDALSEILTKIEIPKWIVDRFYQLNMSVPRFGSRTSFPVDESQYTERAKAQADPSDRIGLGSPMDPKSFPSQFRFHEDILWTKDHAYEREKPEVPFKGIEISSDEPVEINGQKLCEYPLTVVDIGGASDHLLVRKKPKVPQPSTPASRAVDRSTPSRSSMLHFVVSGAGFDKDGNFIDGPWAEDSSIHSPGFKGITVDTFLPTDYLEGGYPKYEAVWDRLNEVGFPQGAPTSPVFSNITLREALYENPMFEVIGYADDGIVLTRPGEPGAPLTQPKYGLFEKEGGSYVKKNGKWLKPLKFLGLVYDPFKDTLSSQTRKGATLTLDLKTASGLQIEDLLREYDTRYGLYHPPHRRSWELFISSHLSGWIQARLYSGSWELNKFWQDFQYSFIASSWSAKIGTRDRYKIHEDLEINTFNSSSIASAWLAAKLSPAKRVNVKVDWLFRGRYRIARRSK